MIQELSWCSSFYVSYFWDTICSFIMEIHLLFLECYPELYLNIFILFHYLIFFLEGHQLGMRWISSVFPHLPFSYLFQIFCFLFSVFPFETLIFSPVNIPFQLQQSNINKRNYKLQKSVSHSQEAGKSEIRIRCLMRALILVHSGLFFNCPGGRDRRVLQGLFNEGTNPIHEGPTPPSSSL